MDQRAKQLAALIGEREVSRGWLGAGGWEAAGLRFIWTVGNNGGGEGCEADLSW